MSSGAVGFSGGERVDPYNQQRRVEIPKANKDQVRKELKELGKLINSSLKEHNVQPDKIQNAKKLVQFIKDTLHGNEENFLTENSTLALIQQIKIASKDILIKDRSLEKSDEVLNQLKKL